MASIDLLLESHFTAEQVRDIIAAALNVDRDRIFVIHDLSEYPAAKTGQVVCNIQSFSEGFCHAVTIDVEKTIDEDALPSLVSRVAGTRCLVLSSEPNPYAVKLFTPDGMVTDAFLDIAALDDRDVYVLA